MKENVLCRNRWRWPSLLFSGSITILGILGLFLVVNPDCGSLSASDCAGVHWFVGVFGFLFAFAGAFLTYETFFNGTVFEKIIHIPFNKLERLEKFENGLFVAIQGVAKVIPPYYGNKIYDRGYIRVYITYNRKKKQSGWQVLSH